MATFLLLSWMPSLPVGALLDPGNSDLVSRGGEIYSETCASCHGRSLEGHPEWQVRDAQGYLPAPPHDETGHTWHHPDAILFSITRDGTAAHAPAGYLTDMPGFGDVLSDDEIWSVLAYIKSRWPKHITARRQAAIREKVK